MRFKNLTIFLVAALVLFVASLFTPYWQTPSAEGQGTVLPYKLYLPFVPRADVVSPNVRQIVIDPKTPTTIYVVPFDIGKGVFKSTDGGMTWRSLYVGYLDPYMVTALAIDPVTPTTLYAGISPKGTGLAPQVGVVKSTDGGIHWNTANTGMNLPSTQAGVFALAVDPKTPTNVYAGTDGSGVFKSANGGATWTAINTGLFPPNWPQYMVSSIAVDPVTPATVYAALSSAAKSTNGGATWSQLNTHADEFVIDPKTPTTLYAGSINYGISKSTDGGATWTYVNNGLPSPYAYPDVYALVVDPQTPTTLYAALSQEGVFKTTNGGASWSAINTGLPPASFYTWPYALAIDPLTPTTVYVAIVDGTPSLFPAGGSGGVFKSTDGGATWHAINWPPS